MEPFNARVDGILLKHIVRGFAWNIFFFQREKMYQKIAPVPKNSENQHKVYTEPLLR